MLGLRSQDRVSRARRRRGHERSVVASCSANPRASIGQRGHAEQKHHDLRRVGLGFVVARAGTIPLLGHADAGDRPDVTPSQLYKFFGFDTYAPRS